MIGRLALMLLALAAPIAASTAELKPFQATYTIRWNGMTAGSGELQLERLPDGRWSYKSRVQGRGMFRLALPSNQVSQSVFRIVDERVVPETFVSDDAKQKITFDWAASRVTGTVNGKSIDLPTQPGLLDPTSVQVALMYELITGRMPSRFVLVDEDRIKDYLYAVEGSETLDSAAGKHRTDIFSSRRPGSKNATFFWCASELGYLPLKVERRKGREVEWSMTLTKLTR
jgi:hypothetical protein